MADYWDTSIPDSQLNLNPVESAERYRILTGGLTAAEMGEEAQRHRMHDAGWFSGGVTDRPAASFKDNLRAIGLIMLLVFVIYGGNGNRSQSAPRAVDESSSSEYEFSEAPMSDSEPALTSTSVAASSTSSVAPETKSVTFRPSGAAYAFLYSLVWFALATLTVHASDSSREDWQTILKKSALAPFGMMIFLAVATFLVTFLSMLLGRLVLGWKDGFDPGIVFQVLLVAFVVIAGFLVSVPFFDAARAGYRPKTRWKFTLPAFGSLGLLTVVAVALFGTVRRLFWS